MSLWLSACYGYQFKPQKKVKKRLESWMESDDSNDFYSAIDRNFRHKSPHINICEEDQHHFFSAQFSNLDAVSSGMKVGFETEQFIPNQEFVKLVDEAFTAFLASEDTPEVFKNSEDWVKRPLILSVVS
jgi:hypothetical protein